MKNKSSNHKSTNRFKFTTFADRVNEIDVRHAAIYHLDHVNTDAPLDNETFFYNAIQKWKVLNLTTEYVNFSKKVENIVTLPQLLHRKDEVVELVLEYLGNGSVLTLQPLLEIVVVLAKDLHEDFYKYFPRFLDMLIRLLNTKEPEQLEWTLICLAFLFKSLKVFLKRDIIIVFDAVLPLLSDSMPWYINNFAAESFAFVARDIKDKRRFIQILVKSLDNRKNGIVGCGRLLFEVVRGVDKQFHSCSSSFLTLLFECLDDKSIDRETMFKILTQTVADMLHIIHPKNNTVFWSAITDVIHTKVDSYRNDNFTNSLEHLLMLLGQALDHGSGSFMTDPFPVVILIIKLLKVSEYGTDHKILKVTSKIGVLVLLCKHINLPQEESVSLVKMFLSMSYSALVLNFVEELITYPSFDMIILPYFINSIKILDSEVIQVLSKVCLAKSPLCKSGIDLYSWVKYPIDFELKSKNFSEILFKTIKNDLSEIIASPDECVCALICLPHIKNLNLTQAHEALKCLLSRLIDYLKSESYGSEETSIHFKNALFIMAIAMESTVHTTHMYKLQDFFLKDIIDVLLPHASNPHLICSLRILDLVLTVTQREKTLEFSLLETIDTALAENLTSSFHEVRLLTTHLYSLFEDEISKQKNSLEKATIKSEHQKESFEVFSLCYSVESLPISVTEYREQLMKLSKMTYGSPQYILSEKCSYNTFALKYAIGLLHINFKLLWEPLQTLILSYAQGLPINKFWEVFHPCLQQVVHYAREGLIVPSASLKFTGDLNFLQIIFFDYYNTSNKPEFGSYRIRLWEILFQTPAISESKNRDITPIFLDFLKVEFEKSNQVIIFKDDLCDVSIMDSSDIVELEDPEFHQKDEEHRSGISKSTYETFIACLKVYSNIQNPKAMYKEETLRKIYLDYLMHKNPILQKIALDCFMRYKNKHLSPYKEHLYNLVDGKKFKDELRTFRIQPDEDGIREEDRSELIPIILRIAFSKMITNTGVDKKGGSQLRRSLVMRFLSGCKEDELLTFTDMAFHLFGELLQLKTEDLAVKAAERLAQGGAIPPRRLLGALQLVEAMRAQLSQQGRDSLLQRLLHMLFCVGAETNAALDIQGQLRVGYIGIMKDIRNRCILSVSTFFQQFDKYNWSYKNDILPVFNLFVWPTVEKLPKEGIHSPTPLLKLFNVWSQIPQYHSLFSVCSPLKSSLTTLPLYFMLMSANKIHHSVIEMCMQILERLLTMDVEEGECVISIPSTDMIPLDTVNISSLVLTEKLNYGSSVLMPHIPVIVDILKEKLANINPKRIQKRELVILSRVTELVCKPEIVANLLTFSLPILIHRVSQGAVEDTLEASIVALTGLLDKANNSTEYVRLIAPLFSKVKPAGPRKSLCKVLQVLAANGASQDMATVITDMNACDEKWLEQPDFDTRLTAFKQIYRMADESQLDVDLGALVIHNCFFTLQHENDLSLRNSASACLLKITPMMALRYKDSSDKDYLLRDTVLLLIRNSLKGNVETLKMEAIALLGEMVRECSDVYIIFEELHPFSNKANKEIDFFENLQHLQFHRKIRALKRVCTLLAESPQVPGCKTLTQFIIPLATQFICSEKYTPKYALVDAAIDTVGAVCRLLPWRQYEAILKFYVGKLQSSTDYQKQLIKLVSAILDAFHYDLSKVDGEIPQVSSKIESDIIIKATDEKEEEMLEVIMDLDIPQEDEVTRQPGILPWDRVFILSPSTAKRVIATITETLTQLDWSSSRISEHESAHKSVRKGGGSRREAEEKLKLPMALAVVKLLQKLPQPMLKNNLLSVLIKVCNFLKSPMVGVRSTAREIISKIMLAVGTSELGTLLSHLTALLTRGIHVHVLISTVHTVLMALKESFGPGEMDRHMHNVMTVCLNDLFGKASEEKEVIKLGNKAPEAKPSMKSFSTLRIIAQNVGERCFINLLKPFKDVAEKSHSKRMVLKVQSALQNISIGLAENKNTSIEGLLVFIKEVLSDNIEKLQCGVKRKAEEELSGRAKLLKTNCLIITPSPKSKSGLVRKVIRSSAQVNAHVITEFGLSLLYTVLQKDKICDEEHLCLIDQLMPFVLEALGSSQVKVATLAMKCITSLWVKRLELPLMKIEIKNATFSVFKILHKYATSGLSKKDDNFHLVANAFKAVTALIREVKYHTISPEEMKTLLLYAEHDIHDSERQATAFSLLKAIVSAKYKIPEIHEVMKKVSEISIISESVRTREESRYVMIAFLMNYPLNKKIENHIQFYITQLDYELEHGRKSAICMLQALTEKFTMEILNDNAAIMYVSLGGRLINDPSTECRMLVAECLEQLLSRISPTKRNELFNINMALLNDSKPIHTEMAAQLCSRFVNVEKHNFKSRLNKLLPELTKQMYGPNLNIGRFVRPCPDSVSFVSKEFMDNSYIQVLNLLNKLSDCHPIIFTDPKYQKFTDEIAAQCQGLLAHSHSWVRHNSAVYLAAFLESINPAQYARIVKGLEETDRLVLHSVSSLKSLTLDLCSQFIPGSITSDLADEVCKNLLILLKLTSNLGDEQDEDMISEFWIVSKLKSAINSEVTKSPGTTIVRMSIFKMLEKLLDYMDKQRVFPVMRMLMPCLVREMTKTDATFEDLKNQADVIGSKMSAILGDIIYNELLVKVQTKLNTKRKDRKQKLAQDKINNPERAAKRKNTIKEKKRDYKRKKMDIVKGRAPRPKHASKVSSSMKDF